MVITVTGSTGTIGSELMRLLSDRRTLTRAIFRDTRRLRVLPNVAWVYADLRDANLLELPMTPMRVWQAIERAREGRGTKGGGDA